MQNTENKEYIRLKSPNGRNVIEVRLIYHNSAQNLYAMYSILYDMYNIVYALPSIVYTLYSIVYAYSILYTTYSTSWPYKHVVRYSILPVIQYTTLKYIVYDLDIQCTTCTT